MRKKEGSTFLTIISILGIIFFATSMFIGSTVEERRLTNVSIHGMQAQCLAEAALERTMSVISGNINSSGSNFKNNLALILKLPMKKKSGGMAMKGSLGIDAELDYPEDLMNEIVFTENELNTDDNKCLNELVNYMTSGDRKLEGGIKEYHVNVKAALEKVFAIGYGNKRKDGSNKEYDYEVPGVDIEWNLRDDVKDFLDGKGYKAITIKFPKKLNWLNLSVPVKLFGIKITSIDLIEIFDAILGKNGFGLLPLKGASGTQYTLKGGNGNASLSSLDGVARLIINDLIGGGEKYYPIEIRLDKLQDLTKPVSALWPSNMGVNEEEGQSLEKYGQIRFTSEAIIHYKDGQTSRRCISAIKDFKVADCEPIAPMYSFFIANSKNSDDIDFNNYGGEFYVQNYDYFASFFLKAKNAIVNTFKKDEDKEKNEEPELPGLIRVNHYTEDDAKHPICNVSFMGNPLSRLNSKASFKLAKNFVNGMDVPIMLNTEVSGSLYSGNGTLSIDAKFENPDARSKTKSKKINLSKEPKKEENKKKVQINTKFKWKNKVTDLSTLTDDALKKLNVYLDFSSIDTNIIEFAMCMAEQAITSSGGDGCFTSCELPYMGTGNSYFCLPSVGIGSNKSHLFGYGGLSPTMTKEIEGDVLKQYRKWSICIIQPMVLPPWMVTVPPFPIPIWYADPVVNKYCYNLACFAPTTKNDEIDTNTYPYDPSDLGNMPPNLYTAEQYIKKASYYYSTYDEFLADLPYRICKINDDYVFVLNGITYVAESMGKKAADGKLTSSLNDDFAEALKDYIDKHKKNGAKTPSDDELKKIKVVGKGMIVCGGNIYVNDDISTIDINNEKTVFTLMSRNGAILLMDEKKDIELNGCVYTHKGLYCTPNSSITIKGNWVTDNFAKQAMQGDIAVDYISSRVRTSLNSLHPTKGKYDPNRYNVFISPTWSAWRVE